MEGGNKVSSIDERIVKLTFDNDDFKSKVTPTLSMLDKLKEKLNFKGASSGLKETADATTKVTSNLSGVQEAIDTVNNRFSALGVAAATVISNITNKLTNLATSVVKSFTIDPIMAGFHEYETQIGAIQTIMANTAGAFNDSMGNDQHHLDVVNDKLNELNTYADKTIYNFTEMTRNIGTFTAAGVDLDTSVNSIRGIANLAAVSGSTSQQASVAMYQLSQAIASGTVRLMDWNSVVNAGMGGKTFQDALIRTSEHLQTGAKAAIAANGSFRESLQTGWLTTQVLTDTLSQMQLNVDTQEDYNKVVADLVKQGYTEQEAKDIASLAKNASDAATKVKTFSMLMDTLKEAVGSGWTQTWSIIIGDFGESKNLWTGISNYLSDIINKSANARNEVLQGWHDLGGRTEVLNGLKNIFSNLEGVVKAVGQAFRNVFPPKTSQQLYDMSKRFADFTASMKISQPTLDSIRSVFQAIFKVLSFGIDIIKKIGTLLGPLLHLLGSIAGAIFRMISPFTDAINKANGFSSASEALGFVIKKLGDGINALSHIIDNLGGFFQKVGQKIADFFSSIKIGLPIFKAVGDTGSGVKSVLDGIGDAFTNMKNKMSEAIKHAGGFGNIFLKIGVALQKGVDYILDVIDRLITILGSKNAAGAMDTVFLGVQAANSVKMTQAITSIFEPISSTFKNIADITKNASNVVKGIADVFGSLSKYLKALTANVKATALIKIAVAISLLSAAVAGLGRMNTKDVAKGVLVVGILAGILSVVLNKLDNVLSKSLGLNQRFTSFKDMIINGIGGIFTSIQSVIRAEKKAIMIRAFGNLAKSLGVAIALVSASMVALSTLSPADIAKSLFAVTAIAGMLIGITYAMDKACAKANVKTKVKTYLSLILLAEAIKTVTKAFVTIGYMSWDGITKGLVGVGGMLVELVGTVAILDLIQKKFKSVKLKTMLSIIALSLVIGHLGKTLGTLAQYDWKTLAKSVAAMGAMMFSFTGAIRLLSNVKIGLNTLVAMGSLSDVVGKMVDMMKIISGIKSEDIKGVASGAITMVATILSLAAAIRLIGDTEISLSTSVAIFAMGETIKLIGSVLEDIGKMSFLGSVQSVLALTSIMIMLSGFMMVLDNVKVGVSTSIALLTIGQTVKMISDVLTQIAAIPTKGVIKAVLALTAIFIELQATLLLLDGMKIGLGASVALLAIAASLTIVTNVIKEFAKIKVGTIVKALVSLAVAIAAFAGLSIILSAMWAPMLIGAGVLAAFSAAVMGLGVAIATLSAGLIAIGPALVSFTTSMTTNASLINSGIGLAVATLINSIRVMINSVLQLVIDVAPKILEAVSAIISAILGALTENVPKFIELIGQIIDGLTELIPKVVTLFVTTVTSILDALAENAGQWSSDIGDFIFGVIDGALVSVTNNIPKLADDFGQMVLTSINSITAAIIQYGPKINEAIKNLLAAISYDILDFIQSLVEDIPFVGDKLGGMLQKGKDKLNDTYNFDDLKEIGKNGSKGVAAGINEASGEVEQAGTDAGNKAKDAAAKTDSKSSGKSIAEKFASGIRSVFDKVGSAGKDMADEGKKSAESVDFSVAGVNSGKGYANGIDSTKGEAEGAAKGIGAGALGKLKNFLGIHSPSTEFRKLGVFSGKGFIKGLKDTISNIASAAKDVANGALSSIKGFLGIHSPSTVLAGVASATGKNYLQTLKDAMLSGMDMVNGELNLSPTITPVVDLDKVQSAITDINKMQGTASMNVTAIPNVNGILNSSLQSSSNIANDTAKNLAEAKSVSYDNPAATTTNNATYTFNQYNTSPKELNRIDIYRDSKNLLSQFREAHA